MLPDFLFAFIFLHLRSPLFTFIHLRSPSFTFVHIHSPLFTFVHLPSTLTSNHLNVVLFVVYLFLICGQHTHFVHLPSPSFTFVHLPSPWFTSYFLQHNCLFFLEVKEVEGEGEGEGERKIRKHNCTLYNPPSHTNADLFSVL